MKRLLSIFLALILIIALVPIHTFAAEAENAEYNRVIDLACEVFPEYKNEITDTSCLSTVYARSSEPSIVYTETRLYDEDTFVTYSKLSNGAVVLSVLDPTDSMVITNSEGDSRVTTYTATLTLALTVYQGIFKAQNVMFTIASETRDVINSPGTISATNACRKEIYSSSYTESSVPARVTYRVCFDRADVAGGYQHVQFYYTLYVGGNRWWTTVTQ